MSRVYLDATTCEFMCPGCGQRHVLPIGKGISPSWFFTGDVERPTLSPSIAARGILGVFDYAGDWTGEWQIDAAGSTIPFVCHSFVRDGRIEFLGDCSHSMAGKTVDLPQWADGDLA